MSTALTAATATDLTRAAVEALRVMIVRRQPARYFVARMSVDRSAARAAVTELPAVDSF